MLYDNDILMFFLLYFRFLSCVECYNLDINKWIVVVFINVVCIVFVVVVMDGKIYLVGGYMVDIKVKLGMFIFFIMECYDLEN